jgi:hypothetical protein
LRLALKLGHGKGFLMNCPFWYHACTASNQNQGVRHPKRIRWEIITMRSGS